MYRLPDSLRPALAAPFGVIHDTRHALKAAKGRTVVTVGDVVTRTFLEEGIVPKLMIVDGLTLRGTRVEAPTNVPEGTKHVTVDNPPATITKPLIVAIDRAMREKGSTLIHVKGEEDLAALPVMIIAPAGTAVCYGQPREGVVVVLLDDTVRKRAQDILDQMEVK